jgi:glutathione S-transferase
MIDFNGSTLLVSARSPFARRVRLAFLESGIRFEQRVLDVLKPNAEVIALNPMGRVPTVRLKSGEVLYESGLILQLLYEGGAHPLHPRTDADRLEGFRWSADALGLCERAIDWFFENLRPEAERDPEVLTEVREVIDRVLTRLESQVGDRPTLLSSGLSQCDLDMGTALTYLTIRYPHDWQRKFPRAEAYRQRLEERPSFRATVPPPPA